VPGTRGGFQRGAEPQFNMSWSDMTGLTTHGPVRFSAAADGLAGVCAAAVGATGLDDAVPA